MTQPSNSRPASTGDLLISITGANPGKVEIAVGTERVVRGDVVFPPDFNPIGTSARIRARMAGATRDAVLRDRSRNVVEDEETVGQTLFRALFRGPVRSRYDVWRQNGGRVRLRLEAGAEQVAWELLRSEEMFFLATHADTLLIREVSSDVARREPSPVPKGGLRILACLSSPAGLPELAIEKEKTFLRATLAGAGTVEIVPDNLSDLRAKLRDENAGYHVFHFGGHGASKADGKGYIFLSSLEPPEAAGPPGAAGAPTPEYTEISDEVLALALGRCKSLRLVVLNACEGATPGSTSNAVSLAERLVAAGVPAVLAMQSSILDTTAEKIVREFYQGLADDTPIEKAVNTLREGLFAAKLEWAAPVLTMSHPETPLFEVFDPKEQAAEEEAKKKAEAEEAARKRAEAEEAARKKAEEEAKKKARRRTIAIVAAVLGIAVLVVAYLSFGPNGSGQFQITSVTSPPSSGTSPPAPVTVTSSAPATATSTAPPQTGSLSATPTVTATTPSSVTGNPTASTATPRDETCIVRKSTKDVPCGSCPINHAGCMKLDLAGKRWSCSSCP